MPIHAANYAIRSSLYRRVTRVHHRLRIARIDQDAAVCVERRAPVLIVRTGRTGIESIHSVLSAAKGQQKGSRF